MGRGLSELQKAVLRHAAQRSHVCRAVLLAEVFGWTRKSGRPVRDYGKNFRPAAIGQAKYRTDNASLSRALRRLTERGLLTDNRSLTDAGRELVRSWGIEPLPAEPPGRSVEELVASIKALNAGANG
jgi:hypothetical protein